LHSIKSNFTQNFKQLNSVSFGQKLDLGKYEMHLINWGTIFAHY